MERVTRKWKAKLELSPEQADAQKKRSSSDSLLLLFPSVTPAGRDGLLNQGLFYPLFSTCRRRRAEGLILACICTSTNSKKPFSSDQIQRLATSASFFSSPGRMREKNKAAILLLSFSPLGKFTAGKWNVC